MDIARRVARFSTVPVLHADFAGQRPYIVSEYVPGPSLHTLVTLEGPRRGAALDRLAISTATALAAIHRAGVLHRDLKPANILSTPDPPRAPPRNQPLNPPLPHPRRFGPRPKIPSPAFPRRADTV
ncbi:hypothetical protein GCM10018965_038260 [Nonomuraea roseola]